MHRLCWWQNFNSFGRRSRSTITGLYIKNMICFVNNGKTAFQSSSSSVFPRVIFNFNKFNILMCFPSWIMVLAAAAKSLQSCPTLCDPIDGSPLGSSVPGILQARILEWVAISFSNAWKWKVKVKSFSRAQLLVTPLTAAYQAPPSMGFSRQEYWSGLSLWFWRYT